MTPDPKARESNGATKIQNLFPEEGSWYEVILGLWRNDNRSEKGDGTEELNSSFLVPDNSQMVPNFSIIGVRRVERDILEFYLYEHSNSFNFISANSRVGLFIPQGPDRMDLSIDCALKGYGSHEREIEPQRATSEKSFAGAVPFPKSIGERAIASVQNIDLEQKEDEYGTIARKCIRVRITKENWLQSQEWETSGERTANGGGSGGFSHAAYSRTEGLLMEALVVGTRYKALNLRSLAEEMEKYLNRAERLGGEVTRERVRKIRELTYSSSRIE